MSALRPSMLELMDSVSVNAVEDMTAMGLDRGAGALLIARSDAGGAGGEAEIAVIAACCEAAGAAEVFSTTDEVEGEALVAARRLALVALERRGTQPAGGHRRAGAGAARPARRHRRGDRRVTTSRSRSSPTRGTATPTR